MFVLFDVDSGVISTHKIHTTPEDPARAVLEGLAERVISICILLQRIPGISA